MSQKNLRIVALKLFELTRFLNTKSPNLQLFTLIFYGVGPLGVRCDIDIFQ